MWFRVVLLSVIFCIVYGISCHHGVPSENQPTQQKYCIYYKTNDNKEKMSCNGLRDLDELRNDLGVPSAVLNQCYSDSKYRALLICDTNDCNTPCTPEEPITGIAAQELSLLLPPNASVIANIHSNPNHCNCNCDHNSSFNAATVPTMNLVTVIIAFGAVLLCQHY